MYERIHRAILYSLRIKAICFIFELFLPCCLR
eukprot:UN17392